MSSIKNGFIKAAAQGNGGIDQTYEQSKLWFENLDNTWLLILDNADNMTKNATGSIDGTSKTSDHLDDKDSPDKVVIDYSQFIPSGDRGSILITTRNKECIEYGTNGYVKFEKLEIEASITLLLKAAGMDTADHQNQQNARNIVGENCLTQHALAIVQAGAFIKQGFCKINNYQDEFRNQRKRLMKHHPKQANSVYGDVYATFEVSAMAMELGLKQEWVDALQLLKVLAFLDRQEVPKEMFIRAWEHVNDPRMFRSSQEKHGIGYLWVWHSNRLRKLLHHQEVSMKEFDSFSFVKARNALQAFSLITFNPESEGISMHPLVHAWAKDRLRPEEVYEAWSTASSILSLSLISLGYDDFYKKIHSHVIVCIGPDPEEILRQASEKNEGFQVCRMFYRFTSLLVTMRHDVLAEKIAELLLSRVGVGLEIQPHSLDWRSVLFALAVCQDVTEKFVKSMQNLEQIELYDASVPTLEFNDTERINIRVALAKSYGRVGRQKEAIMSLEEAIKTPKVAIDPNNSAFLKLQHELANLYLVDQRPKDAVQLLEQVVKIRKTILPSTHKDLLSSRHLLAEAYYRNGQLSESIQLFKEVVEVRKSTLSTSHPNLLNSQGWVGKAYIDNGQFIDAIEFLREVVDTTKTVLPPTDSLLLDLRKLLAQAYYKQRLLHMALPVIQDVVDIRRKILEPANPKRMDSELLLSYCLEDIRDQKHMEGMYNQVILVSDTFSLIFISCIPRLLTQTFHSFN